MAKRDLTQEQQEIQDYLKEKWPSHIGVEKTDNTTITLTLTKEAVGLATESKNNKNMQDNDACFEGWAVALKAKNKDLKIILKVESGLHDFKIEEDGTVKDSLPAFDHTKHSGHYGRFLYRALRFFEQYKSWFSLEESLDRVVTKFKDNYLENKSVFLCNNVPDKEAGKNGKIECYIEALMAETGKEAFLNSLKKAKNEEDINPKQQVYRQLPVGLFSGSVDDNRKVFTGGASAIDLWTLKDDALQVVELKADNKMVGIITEIFFYSNYMYDLLINEKFRSTKPNFNNGDSNNRGYDTLYIKAINKEIKKIEGFMLANEYHPLITPDVLDVLNAGSKNDEIQYFRAEYDSDVTIKQNKRTR